MDELAQLKNFRLEDAAADGAREHARAALHRAMTRRRPALPRRRYALVIAFAVAAVLAAAAYAIVHEFVIGGPAPPEVKRVVGLTFKRWAAEQHERFAMPKQFQGREEDVRIASVTQTKAGPAYLFYEPTKHGSACLFLWERRITFPNGAPFFTEADCVERTPAKGGIGYNGAVGLGFMPHAVSYLVNGRRVDAPFGYFIFATPLHGSVRGYDAKGRLVGRLR
jgi:hypothetical protein